MRIIGAGTREGFEYTVRRTFWTVPNVVTVLRFLLVPVFVLLVSESRYLPAFWVLVALGATDWIDGFIARYFNQLSTVGRWLDPLADRLAVVIVALTLVHFGIAPDWLVWAILIPDVVLFINAAVLFAGNPHLRVSVMGKVRSACLMIGLPLMLLARLEEFSSWWGGLFPLVAESLLMAGAVMHIVASADYLLQAHAKFRRLRTAGISPWDRKSWAPAHAAAPEPPTTRYQVP
ncbi:CDP-alcohol phosphatidyltransferase family protein [Nesterenkonia sp.]|uniref:CDP-alcohol phosphatidyltransferase family protein n=1 Tax=Nesterenkonia sp. TaxID=704201 RepID=UPI00260B7BF5|nr:CDP-alcohol phosphatidyltransferase family protein [Nesterenkonia sp.]